jgi:hypothetical protein
MARVLEVRRIRRSESFSISLQKWNAQWMQNPTSEEGAIDQNESGGRNWEHDYIPPLRTCHSNL